MERRVRPPVRHHQSRREIGTGGLRFDRAVLWLKMVSRSKASPRIAARTPDQTQIDIGREGAERKVAEHLAYAQGLFPQDDPWPDELSRPNVSAVFHSTDGRINNLFYGAVSWMLLHEIAHVHHGDVKLLCADLLVRQEHRADGGPWPQFETRFGVKERLEVDLLYLLGAFDERTRRAEDLRVCAISSLTVPMLLLILWTKISLMP
jgi:hypothetical protein